MTEREMTEFLDSTEVPYCDLAVFRDHKCLFRYGRGVCDRDGGRTVDGTERYNLYSLSKITAAALAAMLIDEGRLSLTDPVSSYLPEYATLTVRSGEEITPCATPMLVGHLATMTAGLDYSLFSGEIKELTEKSGGKATTRQIAAALAKRPLCFEPGTEFKYSLCLDVLGAVMEEALGKSLADIAAERIWEPLGMESTSFGEDDAHRYRVADQYIYEGGQILPTTNECKLKITENFHSLGAGIVTSVDDYMRFLDCLASGGVSSRGVRIMREEAVRLLEVPRLPARPLESFRSWNPIYGGYSYGIGVRVMVEPSVYDGRIPVGEFGWNGACGHYGLVDRKNGISVFYAEHVFKHSPVSNLTVHPKVRSFAYDIAGL